MVRSYSNDVFLMATIDDFDLILLVDSELIIMIKGPRQCHDMRFENNEFSLSEGHTIMRSKKTPHTKQ